MYDKRNKMVPFILISLLIVTSGVLMNCATLNQIVNAQKPQLAVQRARITEVSFETIDLLFDIAINNPNTLSATLSGFDYEFKINNVTFVEGTQNKKLEIPGTAESTVQIPLSLTYKDIYTAFKSLQDSDSSSYELACGFLLEVPVLGRARLPVSHRGRLPLMRFPTIKINTLKLNRINFSGADLDLSVFVYNPNPVGLLVDNFNYYLSINGQQWALGALTQQTAIKERERSVITIPINLNFPQMGQTLYQIIIGNQSLNYHFSGSLDLGSSLSTKLRSNLPFEGSGQLRILK